MAIIRIVGLCLAIIFVARIFIIPHSAIILLSSQNGFLYYHDEDHAKEFSFSNISESSRRQESNLTVSKMTTITTINSTSTSSSTAEAATGTGRATTMSAEMASRHSSTTNTITTTASSSFNFEDEIDLTATPGHCGMDKCFFLSRRNHQIGYLVTRTTFDKYSEYVYQNMKLSWENAQQLSTTKQQQQQQQQNSGKKYHNNTPIIGNNEVGFRHFLAEPPIQVKITNEATIQKLNGPNSSTNGEYNNNYGNTTATSSSSSSTSTTTGSAVNVVVQKVYAAPKGALTLFCHPNQQYRTLQQITQFMDGIKNKTLFKQNFDQEWKYTFEELLVEEPRLWIDFQIIIDDTGKMYHIDLDRYVNANVNGTQFQKNVHRMKHSHCLPFVDRIMNEFFKKI